jgi:hypothetical protein
LSSAPKERFRVMTEHEFFAEGGLGPAEAQARSAGVERRAHRTAGVVMLAGAVGAVGAVIAINLSSRPPRLRTGQAGRAFIRSERRVRPDGTHGVPASVESLRAYLRSARQRPKRAKARVVANLRKGAVRRAVVLRQPGPRVGRGSESAGEMARRSIAAREAARTTVVERAPSRPPTHPVEFSFER